MAWLLQAKRPCWRQRNAIAISCTHGLGSGEPRQLEKLSNLRSSGSPQGALQCTRSTTNRQLTEAKAMEIQTPQMCGIELGYTYQTWRISFPPKLVSSRHRPLGMLPPFAQALIFTTPIFFRFLRGIKRCITAFAKKETARPGSALEARSTSRLKPKHPRGKPSFSKTLFDHRGKARSSRPALNGPPFEAAQRGVWGHRDQRFEKFGKNRTRFPRFL